MAKKRNSDPAPVAAMVASAAAALESGSVKLVKQQINGNERVVLKENATLDDLNQEASRMKALLGYQVKPEKRRAGFLVSHPFYQGKYLLLLEPD